MVLKLEHYERKDGKIYAFEMWYWRWIHLILSTANGTNTSTVEELVDSTSLSSIYLSQVFQCLTKSRDFVKSCTKVDGKFERLMISRYVQER